MADKEDKPSEADTTTVADAAVWKGSLSAKKPQVSPDGHVHLSQEDIDARK